MLMNYNKEQHFQRIRNYGVSRILGLLKASNEMGFKAGLISCLDLLEVIPWKQDDVHKVVRALKDLKDNIWMADAVLRRVPAEPQNTDAIYSLFFTFLDGVLISDNQSVVAKMRPVMADLLILVRKMVYPREERLVHALVEKFSDIVEPLITICREEVCQIGDNSHRMSSQDLIFRGSNKILYLFEIMIAAEMGDSLVELWADQEDLESQYQQLDSSISYPITIITSLLLNALGKGQIFAKLECKSAFLETWLPGFYRDFGTIRRLPGYDIKKVEMGLWTTFMTLSSDHQLDCFKQWFSFYIKLGDECPDFSGSFIQWCHTYQNQH